MKQILAVDENLTVLRQISSYLGEDYEVSLANSGLKALEICLIQKPDLILLDIEMPDVKGFNFITRIKQNPCLFRVPVIFLTTSDDMGTAAQTLEFGAQDFIIKPVEKSILLHRVKLHLGLSMYQARTEQAVTAFADSIAYSIAELVECRDKNSDGHVVRTSKYVELLGRNLIDRGLFLEELNDTELLMIARAAPLHDIGKIAIGDRILLKTGRLDDVEFSTMKRHAEIGEAILERMYRHTPSQSYLRYACLIAGSHHERYDGKGYPQGLKGEDIPLSGRVMAVADVYDALIDNRVYRSGMSHAQACGIINEGAGTQFDPRIVDSFNHVQDQIDAVRNQAPRRILTKAPVPC